MPHGHGAHVSGQYAEEISRNTERTSLLASVRALATTPVKGMRLQSRQAVRLDPHGVAENRRFFLVDARDRMLNGKQLGALSAVIASYDQAQDSLTMAFPDREEVAGTIELAGEIRARFFSRELPASLVVGPWGDALTAYAGHELRLVMAANDGTAVDRGLAGAVSLIGRASVEKLEQLAAREVDVRRFRMLVEVEGIEAHAEDSWVGCSLRIGDAIVRFRGHVGRCLVTGQNPDSGVPDMPTLDLLRSYRHGGDTTEPLAFGIYGEVLTPGLVRIGDEVREVGPQTRD